MQTTSNQWTKKTVLKSILILVINIAVCVGIMTMLFMWDEKRFSLSAIRENFGNYSYVVLCMLLLSITLYFYFLFEKKRVLENGKTLTMVFCILELSLVLCYASVKYVNIYARPFALTALLAYLLLGRREAIFINIIGALFTLILDNYTLILPTNEGVYASLIAYFVAGMTAVFFANRIKTRLHVFLIGLIVIIPTELIVVLMRIPLILDNGKILLSNTQGLFKELLYGLAGGLLASVLVLALTPVLERAFNRLTVFRLRELTSSDAKLIRKMKDEAPGTYNHAAVVAQLAESCAEALGEAGDMARAAALYHDVGKLHQPEYFTENQEDYNLHDELSPELSADIIRSHTVDGYELIRANKLPQFFADVAVQHHGTMPIRYFYTKAAKLTDGELNIEDFSYTGPKPQTKIATIIMIADASEAASRSLKDRTPENVEKVVRGVIEERMDLDQFSDCNITMKELTIIRKTIVSSLSGVFHHRIEYPQIRYKRSEKSDEGTNV